MLGDMMKVFIFDSTDLKRAPYLNYYVGALKKKNIDYMIYCWDKFNNKDRESENNITTIHYKWHKGTRKLLDFIYIAQILKKEIEKGKFTHIVLINSIWAMLLSKTLLCHFKNKYIIDIRDYKCELLPGYKFLLKKVIDGSFFTTISSNGFRKFLPLSNKIYPNHNISNDQDSMDRPTLYPGKKNIKIGYLGHIRYRDENIKLIQHIKKNERYSLYFGGTYAVGCEINEDPSLKGGNIIFGGTFNNSDKVRLYQDIDMIHSNYGNKKIGESTLLPNRLYDSIIFKKPLIVAPHTFMGEIVEKYNLGVTIDLDNENFNDILQNYVDNFNEVLFLQGCQRLFSLVQDEQKRFLSLIDSFLTVL